MGRRPSWYDGRTHAVRIELHLRRTGEWRAAELPSIGAETDSMEVAERAGRAEASFEGKQD